MPSVSMSGTAIFVAASTQRDDRGPDDDEAEVEDEAETEEVKESEG